MFAGLTYMYILIKDGSNAMRLVEGVWKKRQSQLGIKPQTSHFPDKCATITPL